jgi:hypothetical protein
MSVRGLKGWCVISDVGGSLLPQHFLYFLPDPA